MTQPKMTRRELMAGVVSTASVGFSVGLNSDAQAATNPHLTSINQGFMVTAKEAQAWHEAKDSKGPTFAGSPSWKSFVELVEKELKACGVVDIKRNAWTYDRWFTSDWPDDSKWSLAVDGKKLTVSSYGAYSGSTPERGVTAPLVIHEEGMPAEAMKGKIVLCRTEHEADNWPATKRRYYPYPGDYEYLSDKETFPNARIPQKASSDVTMSPELSQLGRFLAVVRQSEAVGAICDFEAYHERIAGLYSFGVPSLYNVPTLFIDRKTGNQVAAAAKDGRSATLRLIAQIEKAETYQIIAFLPGKNYGKPEDEQIMLITHTDGPSISQEDGAFGLLGVVRYFSKIPQAERPRTLLIFLDNRHYMPGAERAFDQQNYYAQHPEAYKPVVGVIAMEHLGQIEFKEEGEKFTPTGLIEHSKVHATNNPKLVEMAIKAVKENKLKRVSVQCVDRPGVNGAAQGRWFGLGGIARRLNVPAFATMGDMSAYWSTKARIKAFNADHFVAQVATMSQLTGELMVADLAEIKSIPTAARSAETQ